MSKVMNLIEEQVAFKFTGKLNILSEENSQILGAIYFNEGNVFHAQFKSSKGIKALYHLVVIEESSGSVKYMLEPEIVDSIPANIAYDFEVTKNKLSKLHQVYENSRSLRPPDFLELRLNPEFYGLGTRISQDEFDVMISMCDYSRVKDIYEHCVLLDHEVTAALVEMKKKSAIAVNKS